MPVDKKREKLLTADQVRSVLLYDPNTGEFRWKVNVGAGGRAGALTGCPDRLGYLRIRFRGFCWYSNRLAWLIMTGEWPEYEVDHKDLNKANNKWNNLRHTTHNQNTYNQIPGKKSKTGLRGVGISSSGKFTAYIGAGGKFHYLGSFDTPERASAVRSAAVRALHGEFGRVK